MSALKQKAVSGVKWSTASQAGRLGTQLLTTIILARLLSPSDFGLVGMAMVVIGFIGIFKDLGTSAAIIQRKEISDALISSIFWVNVGFGALATSILFLLAPLGELLYHEPRVVAILQVLSASFFFSGLGIVQQALLERSVSFNLLAKLEITSVFIGAIIGIGLALAGAGVWSLVMQSLATTFLSTVLLWYSSSWRPQWVFHWKEIQTVSSFSLNLTGFNIFNYFARNADYLLIGRYLGAQDLGYYTLAYRILLFPIQNIAAVIGRVLYPVFSTIQDDNDRFASAYLKVVGSIALISFPLMMGVFVLARPFVSVFFGDTWQPVALLIMILAPVGLIQSVGATVGAIYQVKGRTDWMFRWGIASGSFMIIAFVVGLRWGVVGIAIAYAAASFIFFFPSFYIPFQLTNLTFSRLLKSLQKPFFNSLIMFVLVALTIYYLSEKITNELLLAFSISIGGIIYLTLNWLINRDQLLELWFLLWSKENIHEARKTAGNS